MYRHQKQCAAAKKVRDDLDREHTKMMEEHRMKQQTFKIEKDKIIHEQKLVAMQIKVQKSKNDARTKEVTVRQINKMLKELAVRNQTHHTNQIINQNTNSIISINNINNQYISNQYTTNQLLELGSERVLQSLSMEDKRAILDKRMCSLEKIVELVHCGVQDMGLNILITNLTNKYCYKYDKNLDQFVIATKEEVLEELVETRLTDLVAIYDEFSTANRIDIKTKQLIQKFLEKMEEEDVRFTDDATVYPSFREFKKHNIKIMLYSNRDAIAQKISLVIGDRGSSTYLT